MKMIIVNILLLLVASFSACNSDTATDKIRKYEITYQNNCFAKLIVLDKNDTIYYSNEPSSDIEKCKKIISDKKSVDYIKKAIQEEVTYKNLLRKREYITDSGQLEFKVICGSNNSRLLRTNVDSRSFVSDNFSNLLFFLDDNYNDIYKIFTHNHK